MLDIMYEVPSRDDISEIKVTPEMVENKKSAAIESLQNHKVKKLRKTAKSEQIDEEIA